MKKSLIIELILFISLTIVLVHYGTKIFKHTFDIGTTYHIEFNDIDSIAIGSPVRLMGVDVGHVTKIKGTSDKIYVDFVIPSDKIKIPEGTSATIAFFGIAGSRSIELMPPKEGMEADGIVVSDPIRIGDAFGIVGEFLRVSMISIGGLYEFAKDKTQSQVEMMTNNFLKNTNEADDKIILLTDNITNSVEHTQQGIRNTTTGMGRVYSDTASLNVTRNTNIARYATNLTRRSLMKFRRDVKTFEDKSVTCSDKANSICKKIQTAEDTTTKIDKGLTTALTSANGTLDKFDKKLTQENLDKTREKVEKIKNISEKMKNGF